jgi:hypothetical protein
LFEGETAHSHHFACGGAFRSHPPAAVLQSFTLELPKTREHPKRKFEAVAARLCLPTVEIFRCIFEFFLIF